MNLFGSLKADLQLNVFYDVLNVSIMPFPQVDEGYVRPEGTPIWRLLIDPHIACCSGALVVANVSLAFLEPTISKWMNETMDAEEWQQGLIWYVLDMK